MPQVGQKNCKSRLKPYMNLAMCGGGESIPKYLYTGNEYNKNGRKATFESTVIFGIGCFSNRDIDVIRVANRYSKK